MFTRWWHRRIIRRSKISARQWRRAFAQLPLLERLSAAEAAALRELTILFLHQKEFVGTHRLQVTGEMKLLIALQACLPILKLGIDWYDDWSTLIIYPQGFVPQREEMDENGVVHQQRSALSGEAWMNGPVVLSWAEVANAGALDADNLVIHEFAHKLDMRNGAANGMPPLHRGMQRQQWTDAFAEAYSEFRRRLASGAETVIDAYAATDPAEFFAVLSEVFFECPARLQQLYPKVYRQLAAFYRQDPLAAQLAVPCGK